LTGYFFSVLSAAIFIYQPFRKNGLMARRENKKLNKISESAPDVWMLKLN